MSDEEDFKALEQSRASKRLLGLYMNSQWEDHADPLGPDPSFPENSGIYFLYLASKKVRAGREITPQTLPHFFQMVKQSQGREGNLPKGQEHWNLRSLGRRCCLLLIGPGTNYRLF